MMDDAEESKPLQISPDVYHKFMEDVENNENWSDDDDNGFIENAENNSQFFLPAEATNPLDPNNYLLVNRISRTGTIRQLIMCRSTAQNMVSKADQIFREHKIVNDLWNIENADEVSRVKSEVIKARSRMKKGAEFRVIQKKYIREKIKPKWKNWASTFSTNDGGIHNTLYILLFYAEYILFFNLNVTFVNIYL